MERPLYSFTGNDGSFTSSEANRFRTLYFPLCNERIMSSVTPLLHGDSKTDNDHFLLEPVSRIDLAASRAGRAFWVRFNDGDRVWSATGTGRRSAHDPEDFTLRAGLLWQEVSRTDSPTGLRADILTFVPSGSDPVEIMRITLTNTGSQSCEFVPCAAIPLYCRGAHTIRDHRHVTSLLQRVSVRSCGVFVEPTLLFDETGHHPNKTVYFVWGRDARSRGPESIYPTQEMFCGEGGDVEDPEAVYRDLPAGGAPIQGREPMAGLRFARVRLACGESAAYTVLMGIAPGVSQADALVRKYTTHLAVESSLERTKQHWLAVSRQVRVETGVAAFDNWFHWVSVQPTLRRIFGCSFLPDFDYGKGGRGWRDLWQDCLGLMLGNPPEVKRLMLDSFAGVRMDGSNATIIGKKKGEFIADRNSISRVWMDHGVWPLVTLDVYLQETGDKDILFEQVPYFRDHQTHRSHACDRAWNADRGTCQRTRQGRIYKGTVLEHVLVQNLVQFYNVGEHNHVRLEGADWNDGLDMAAERGESVAFAAMYASNLKRIAELLEGSSRRPVFLAREVSLLLKKCPYDDPVQKQRLLRAYFDTVAGGVSGRKMSVPSRVLARDLREKAEWMSGHIRKGEWLGEGFFNGYYDNRGRRVEGRRGRHVRMMLASQVFPVMSGVAEPYQVEALWNAARKYLKDSRQGGFHLNTDFKEQQHDLGRAFSFVYGDKENGAFFSHMSVMFAYALYSRGFVEEGWTVLKSVIDMALHTPANRIFPCLPEYFDAEGRGRYAYLTGSASWFVLTLVTRVFGIRGSDGNVLIDPRLVKEQFGGDEMSVERSFASRRLKIVFRNPSRLSYGRYRIRAVSIDSRPLPVKDVSQVLIPRRDITALSADETHTIVVELG